MKKKIYKYIKFIFSIMLIISISVPSFAELLSDGSSFVTKAEFDTAMADFNSQLTTFEASINSRIDSQVTSYLDRNGVWSGKTQNMTSSYDFNDPIAFKEKGTYENNWVKFFSGTHKTKLSSVTANTWYHYDEKLWQGVDKDGLMVISLRFDCDSLFKMNTAGVTIYNSAAYEKIYAYGYAITAIPPTESVNLKNNLMNLTTIFSKLGTGDYSETFKNFPFPTSVQQLFFFVSKGWDIYFSTCWQLTTNATGTITIQNQNGNTQYDGSYNLTILDAKIY